jgi:predicted TIM-barrel fold metal-dependent hydrolase
LAETIGVERLMFGSDYPHAEGLEIPTAFIDDLHGFSATDIEKIMRHNVIDFLGL